MESDFNEKRDTLAGGAGRIHVNAQLVVHRALQVSYFNVVFSVVFAAEICDRKAIRRGAGGEIHHRRAGGLERHRNPLHVNPPTAPPSRLQEMQNSTDARRPCTYRVVQ